ncbi:MAG: ribose 5-phosphate isomerase B [bacterium]
MKKLIKERDVIDAWQHRKSEINVAPNAIITPAAADAAKVRSINIVRKNAIEKDFSNFNSNTQRQNMAKIIIGSDHGGYELKEVLKKYLMDADVEVEDVGTHSTESVDYPDFAHSVALKVAESNGVRGVIIDGAGVGSAITANKVPGIRAATCQDVYTTRNSRAHNNANILTLGSRVLGVDVAKEILKVWLETNFEGGRHQRRVDKIIEIDRKYRK